jgi:multiple sugar transport system substrate-binding protein
MRRALTSGIVPRAALTWQEEPVRLAFQTGQAAFMRNWPYAFTLLADSTGSAVAHRFGAAPMPRGPGGAPTAALGGSQLAINARTEHPEAAYALIAFLTDSAQMAERARRAGQYPTRPALYRSGALAGGLALDPAIALQVIEHAVPRPVTPVYTEMSEILQVELHRALSGQLDPDKALHRAADRIRALLERVGLSRESGS